MSEGPLSGLLSRAVVVVDGTGKVAYTEQVPEIGQEPDYDAALGALLTPRSVLQIGPIGPVLKDRTGRFPFPGPRSTQVW